MVRISPLGWITGNAFPVCIRGLPWLLALYNGCLKEGSGFYLDGILELLLDFVTWISTDVRNHHNSHKGRCRGALSDPRYW